MKKLFALALLGALAAGPALAAGMQSQSGMQGGQQSSMSEDTVRQMQQQLQAQGYEVGQVDGIWGPRSRQALMNFQRDQNLPATGSPDQQSMAALGVESDSQQAEMPGQGEMQDMPEGGGMDQPAR
ncbi:peptidoglycan-binding protein [Magnetospirillum sp. UT-4]|uniref:peptidoglycan-binding domain-containing protein n=1 Tax=Magnetospirillum sp. UT-4 TaxID=2681467 RepID=UPI0013840012|nr:peptidoglycan-binding domain-containing protein [Magnetospirillum sp. UT-4]CAA7626508.1 exported hypothetical protein [Magnetospirillum sp. UT-4]